jgi:ankyrin repeat protein
MPNITSALATGWLALFSWSASAMDIDAYKKALIAGDPAPVLAMLRADGGRAPSGPYGQSLLHLASLYPIGENRPRMVAALLANGANVEALDADGATPLNLAAGRDCLDCVKLLLRAGAKVNVRNARGVTALHYAGAEIATVLIAAGADPNAADNEGNRPLHRMYHEAFLVAGVNVRNRHGFTPLHFAALKGDDEGVRWLLSKGADPTAQSALRYEFHELGPEWKANPEVIEPGTRPYDIAQRWHDRTKWSIGTHRKTLEILDQATPRRRWYSR